ncbi:ABC transporter permease [Leptotrichia trevisanii]|uniref:ABC transporter permease n=1 Tax=Leptotrichia trevisanii TaxID=109328 RepID=UPI0026E9359E|nr:ABC transporter permease [Leptotrichia trevisanii]
MKILKEIYNYRQMIYSLVNKELKVRYKGSILGFFWTFLNPLLQLIIYTIVFSVILKSNIKNFHIYLFVGLVPWIFFTTCIQAGSVSIVANKDLVKKIYFPRIVLPIATVNAAFMNMIYTMIVVILTVFFSEIGLSWYILLLPFIMILQYIMVLGITFVFAALNVFFRDLEYILSIVLMAWFYLTPIVYTIDMVPKEYRGIFFINPMTSIIMFYREILYYKKIPDFSFFSNIVLYSIVMIFIGYFIFEKLQKSFAEEL